MTSSTRFPTLGRNPHKNAGTAFAQQTGMCLGRLLAYCAHPFAAWRRVSNSDRALIVATYVGAGYVVTLTALLAV